MSHAKHKWPCNLKRTVFVEQFRVPSLCFFLSARGEDKEKTLRRHFHSSFFAKPAHPSYAERRFALKNTTQKKLFEHTSILLMSNDM
jgi:hypothetical protein